MKLGDTVGRIHDVPVTVTTEEELIVCVTVYTAGTMLPVDQPMGGVVYNVGGGVLVIMEILVEMDGVEIEVSGSIVAVDTLSSPFELADSIIATSVTVTVPVLVVLTYSIVFSYSIAVSVRV